MAIMHHHVPPPVIYAADLGALFTMLGAFFGILPSIAALLAIVVYALQLIGAIRNYLNKPPDA